MILTVDIGNTNIVIGGFCADTLRFSTRIYTQRELEADQYALTVNGILALHGVAGSDIEGIIISSVVPQVTPAVQHALRLLAPAVTPVMFGADKAPQMKICIDNPPELGTDILAGAVAVQSGYPLPAIIIDMGTATKLTALNAAGEVLGVSIMPGLFISLDALTQRASALNGIALTAPQHAIGTNTKESMKSGVILGAASMLDGMIDRFEAELGPVRTVVATGGAAGLVISSCRHTIEQNETLILQGLYKTYINLQA